MVRYSIMVGCFRHILLLFVSGLSCLTEFKVFVDHAERELRQLFESIDRDHNGELDKGELKAAFRRAGLAISNAKLDQFFDEVDVNHDGVISFEEWR
jgi:solute carrier family 25 (mitochondrial phosphate transporter), member 23/24/25/41